MPLSKPHTLTKLPVDSSIAMKQDKAVIVSDEPSHPEGWEVRRLHSLGTFKSGNGFPLRFQGGQSGDYPFFKVSDMNNEGNSLFMDNSNNWISEAVRKKLGDQEYSVNTMEIASIPCALLGDRIDSLEHHHQDIVDAIDFLLQGF